MTALTTRVLPSQAGAVRRQLELISDRLERDPVLERGDHGAAVTGLQRQLISAGLLRGEPTGRVGAATEAALEKLQRQRGLPVTGALDRATLREVRSLNLFVRDGFEPWAREGQRGDDILRIEQALNVLRPSNIRADGVFDGATERAVRAFQRNHGLRVTGAINPRTADEIGEAAFVKAWLQQARSVTGYVGGAPQSIRILPVGGGEWLRTDAAIAFKRMQQAAAREGVTLSPGSGFRTMDEQRRLYALYLSGQGNLAARPGTSNHQGGVAMDLNGVGGYGTRAYGWLSANAGRFGFVNDVGGEYWHWTYTAGR